MLARFVTRRAARQEAPDEQEADPTSSAEWTALNRDEMNKAVADLGARPQDQKPDA